MIKCPFCGFENEDGALFCEQCKSDLSSATPPAAPPPPPPADVPIPFAVDEPIPIAPAMEENVPMAAVVEAMPVEDIPMAAIEPTVPMAAVVEAAPVAEIVPAPMPVAPEPPPAPPAPAPEPPPAAAAPPPAPAAAPAAGKSPIPPGSEVKLLVIRGQRINVEFPVYGGQNFIGRADEKPVDIDLEDQEPPDRVWTSRQHAVLEYDDASGNLTLEDLNSSNGTYLNRGRVYPGQKQQLFLGDVIQIGTIHLRVKV